MDGEILFDITYLRFPGKVLANVNEDQFKLSNGNEIREKFFNSEYKKQYGLSETSYIPGSVFGYSRVTLENTDGKLVDQLRMEFEEMMLERKRFVEALIIFLWFVKDNSVGMFNITGVIPAKNITNRISNVLGTFNCLGKKTNTVFTKEEVLKAASLTLAYEAMPRKPQKPMSELILPYELDQRGKPFRTYLQRPSESFAYNDQTSIERALAFLMTARAQSIIIYKIGFYMAAFESLFTTNSSEITMRMSYRVAFYIGESLEDCKGIAKIMKDAYDIRSKFLHGQEFGSLDDIELQRIQKFSANLDDYLRRALNKIMTVDPIVFSEYGTKDRELWLDSLVFDLPFAREQIKINRDIKLAKALDERKRLEAEKQRKAEKATSLAPKKKP